MTNQATDQRPAFFSIEETVVDDYELDPLAGWLYVVIVRHINRKKNDAFPSVARLAKLAHMSKRSVIRYTKALEDKGLIYVSREKDEAGENLVNHYKLLIATQVVPERNNVVTNSHHVGATQSPQVVSDVAHNQKNTNQKKEPEIKDKEIEAPADPVERKKLAEQLFNDAVKAKDANQYDRPYTDAEIQAQIKAMYAKHGTKAETNVVTTE